MKSVGKLFAAFTVFAVTSNNGRFINKVAEIKLTRNNTSFSKISQPFAKLKWIYLTVHWLDSIYLYVTVLIFVVFYVWENTIYML